MKDERCSGFGRFFGATPEGGVVLGTIKLACRWDWPKTIQVGDGEVRGRKAGISKERVQEKAGTGLAEV